MSWPDTIDRVSPGIVTLSINSVRPFEGVVASSATGTGFVVDAKLGIILTARHVVTTGPIRGVATFSNQEEVPVYALYFDPVHDFGFLRFDPSRVHFMDVIDIELFAEGARVGTEISVVGSDLGEKLSIMRATIARLDRECPAYRKNPYKDVNTFYLSANSNTSGGSSGSPVLNINGKAVALNVGGSTISSASFYFPLHRVVRALNLLRADGLKSTKNITRGTIQTIFSYTHFAETRRLGLPTAMEAKIRKKYPTGTGMLVVSLVVPEGPGAMAGLQPGDILLALNGVACTSFNVLEATMDSLMEESEIVDSEAKIAKKMSRSVNIVAWRGKEQLSMSIAVENLHDLIPRKLLQVGDCVFQELSYMLAKRFNIRCGGVYSTWAGYMLDRADIKDYFILDSIGNDKLTGIDHAAELFSKMPNQTSVLFRYRILFQSNIEHAELVKIDRCWFPLSLMVRNDASGLWDKTNVGDATPKEITPKIQSTTFMSPNTHKVAAGVYPSLVTVKFDVPLLATGAQKMRHSGVGIIIDSKKGLVLCDRYTVPISLGDVELCVAGSIHIRASVVFLHPVHNVAVLQYDPQLLGTTPVRSIKFSSKQLKPGDTCYYFGISDRHAFIVQNCKVTRKEPFSESLDTVPPRYVARNVELLHMDRITSGVGGVYADQHGHIQAIKARFGFQINLAEKGKILGVPVECLMWMIDTLRGGGVANVPAPSAPQVAAGDGAGAGAGNGAGEGEGEREGEREGEGEGKGDGETKHGSSTASMRTDTNCESPTTAQTLCSESSMAAATIPTPVVFDLSVEFGYTRIADAREGMGLSEAACVQLSKKYTDVRHVLRIKRVFAMSLSDGLLKTGDLLVAIDGELCCKFRDVEIAIRGKQTVSVALVRSAREVTVVVPVTKLGSDDTVRIVQWAGMLLEPTYPSITMSIGYLPKEIQGEEGVYCSRFNFGSPAHMFHMPASTWIISVNEIPTPNLDSFLDAVRCTEKLSCETGQEENSVILKCVDRKGEYFVKTLQPDPIYWPSIDLRRKSDGFWERDDKST